MPLLRLCRRYKHRRVSVYLIAPIIKLLILTRLISIMLSRLRMTVDECIDEYKTLGDKVFGHPRIVSSGGILWHKLNCKVFEEVLKDVTAKYCEKTRFESNYAMERTDQDMCQWYVNGSVILPGTDVFENKHSTCIRRHWHQRLPVPISDISNTAPPIGPNQNRESLALAGSS